MTSAGTGAATAAPILDGLTDDELFADAVAAEQLASPARWRAADCYAELHERGYSTRQIGERVGKSHSHIVFCLKVVTQVTGERGDFQVAYEAAKTSTKEKKPHSLRPRGGLWQNEEVITWIGSRRKAGRTRDQITADGNAGLDGWPLPGKHLPQNSVDIALAILDDRANGTRPEAKKPKKGPTWGGKRKRKLYEQIREDGDTRLRRLQVDISDAVRKLEHMVLPSDIGLSEESQEAIGYLYEDLIVLQEWTESAVTATVACMGELKIRETIRKAEELARDPGAGEGERRNALAAIERLKKKHQRKLSS